MALGLTAWGGPDGQEMNPGGLPQHFYVGRVREATTFPDIVRRFEDVATDNREMVVVESDIVFGTNQGFFKMYVTQDSAGLEAESTGGTDGMSGKGMYKAFMPGDDPEVTARIRLMQNDSFILLVEQLDGRVRMMGSPLVYAKMVSWKHTTAKLDGTEVRGYEVTFRDFEQVVKYYEGVITEAVETP